MSETAVLSFTPGPWRIDSRRSLRVVAGDDDTVASVGSQPSLQDDWVANARLIASAPDMLKALEYIASNSGERTIREMARVALAAANLSKTPS